MDVSSRLIEYIAEYQLFYCHSCHSAYVFAQLDIHLKQKHALPSQARQRLIQDFQQLPLPPAVRHRTASYRQPAKANYSHPVSFLPILDGFTCSHCHSPDSYSSLNRKAIQEHINQAHQLFRTAGTIGIRTVKLQTWYSNNRAQYWEVTCLSPYYDTILPSSSPTPATATAATATATARAIYRRPSVIDLTTADQLEEIEEEESQRLEQFTSHHSAIDYEVEADQTTPWLVATEWLKQFASRPLELISRFARHPEPVAVAVTKADAYPNFPLGSFQRTQLYSPGRDE